MHNTEKDKINLKKERISLVKESARALRINITKPENQPPIIKRSEFSPNDLAEPNLEATNTLISDVNNSQVDPDAADSTLMNMFILLIMGFIFGLSVLFIATAKKNPTTPTTITMSAPAPASEVSGDEGLAMNEIPNTGPTSPRTTTAVTSGKQRKYRFWLVEKLGKAYEGEGGYNSLEVLCDTYTNIVYYREISDYNSSYGGFSAPVMQFDPEDGSPLTLRRYYEIYHE